MFVRASFPVVLCFLMIACQGGRGSDLPGDTVDGSGDAGIKIIDAPFQICVGDTLCTVASASPVLPLPYSYAEGTAPGPFPGTAGVFPALGWLVGTSENHSILASPFQGNRLSGVDSGVVYEVIGVLKREQLGEDLELELATNVPGAAPARLRIRPTAEGGHELWLRPPPEITGSVAATLFTLDSPADEGVFGLGARKDRFNQRGHIRNVWTEQQNTGLSNFAELSGQGGIPGFDQLDLEDAIFQDERATFPNGAQAAYWVEGVLFGSRGWAVWLQEPHFQRLDLAVDAPDRLRWSIIGAEEVHIGLAAGTLEQASQAYTGYWGRAPAPPGYVYEPWIQTLNQGEGEAAPNGQGYWGGQRARCEIEQFMNRAEQHEIPFHLIGVEGWQSLPLGHPSCQSRTLEEICASLPTDATSYAADEARFDDCRNERGENYLDHVRQRGFELAGYWNMFHTDPACPGDSAAGCTGSAGVPLASQQAYYQARDQDLFVKNALSGADHQVVTNRQGLSAIIDFTHPDVLPFWQAQLSRMWDQGIYAFMHDFGELTTEEMQFASGQPIIAAHNEYARAYQRAARQAADRYEATHPEADIFFYGRAGMTGACAQTPGVFPGDESTTWDLGHGLASIIPTMLNLSLSGCYAFTTDVGGYMDLATPRTSEELFIRWSQAAALSPIMRLHNSTFKGSVYPWTFAEEAGGADQFGTIDIFRRYARLKSRLAREVLLPWAEAAASRGRVGPVRPIVLEDQSPAALAIDHQWLLGQDILVAPVIAPGVSEQSVYFPQGANWERVTVGNEGEFITTGEIYTGGQSASVVVSMTDIPLFLRRAPPF